MFLLKFILVGYLVGVIMAAVIVFNKKNYSLPFFNEFETNYWLDTFTDKLGEIISPKCWVLVVDFYSRYIWHKYKKSDTYVKSNTKKIEDISHIHNSNYCRCMTVINLNKMTNSNWKYVELVPYKDNGFAVKLNEKIFKVYEDPMQCYQFLYIDLPKIIDDEMIKVKLEIMSKF
jgi:hypothetical protein